MPAGKGSKDGGEKKKRSRDDDGKERRKAKDDVNGDDKKSRKKDNEEDRERLRQERREKRGGDSKKKEDRPRREEEERPKREDSARRHRKRDEEEKRRPGDEDGERKRHRDKESKHQDKEVEDDEERERRRRERRERREKEKKDEDRDEKLDEDEERERRRQERRERRDKKEEDGGDKERKHKSKRDHEEDDEEKEKKHRDREERHHDKEDRRKDRDKDRDRDREKEREERRRDREEKNKDRKDRVKDKESREDRTRREEEEKRRREEEEQHKEKKKETDHGGREDDDYDYADDDFEDYEDDFEDDDMNEGRRRKKINYPNRKHSISPKQIINEGEMEEVLRALDEENARLTSLSQRSNWSDSTELSDERFKEGEGPGHQDGRRGGGDGDRGSDSKPASRPKTFINFVSAKQRVLNQSQASKARRRAHDLRSMIELDTVYYDLLDLPPVREYDLYIRSFGRSNTKQAYVQTNEDAVEREIQTEETEDMDKWTQHPAEDMGSVGGDGISVKTGEEETASTLSNLDTSGRVGKFLDRAAQVMVILIEEEKNLEEGGGKARERSSNISISEGFSQLGCPPYLAGRRVDRVSFCPLQPNMLLTLHSQPLENAPQSVMNSYGIICVWNVKETAFPQKVLTSLSQPTCVCFSPSRAALVIAGMYDGSVMVWDLREPSALHRSVLVGDLEVTTRFPTYNTAGVLAKENHRSPVAAITAVHPAVLRKKPEDSLSADTEGSLAFQLASVEETATVNLWVVTEISSPDLAGSEVDLGLAPGGRVKLLRSAAIVLENPNKLANGTTLKALDIQLSPSDLNHFFVASDMGQIIHGVRFGSRVFPRAYHPEIDAPKQITCIDFSPFGEPYFLAGCEDGSLHLYHTSQKHPLSSWSLFSEGHSILSVQWSRSRPAVFLVVAQNSTLYTFDLVETGLVPVKSDHITSGRITAMAVASDPALIGGNRSLPAHLLVALDTGTAELHTISTALRQQQPLECDFLSHYSDRF